MRTFRVSFREYRVSMHRVVTVLEAPDAETAERMARSGQGSVSEDEELDSMRAGELTGYLDYETGMRFLPHDVAATQVTPLAEEPEA